MRLIRAVSLSAVCMLQFLGGCAGRGVTVEGAVKVQGSHPYRSGWSAEDYLVAAGGILEEADLAQSLLIRPAADTTGDGRIEFDRIEQWPFTKVPEPIPGDQILIAWRTYPVRMDTLKRIAGFQIRGKDLLYTVPEGVLALGSTDRGPVAAVVLGRGEIHRGRKLEGPFHYLHLTFHPSEFDEKVAPQLGEVIDNPEASEDALAVHSDVFARSRYNREGRSRLPAPSVLDVQAGFWLKPKSKAHPGPGMRKWHYEDGRVWTTFPDGRQRMQFPDGRVEVDHPDGSRHTRHSDGRVSYRDAEGARRTEFPDGREVLEWTTGTVVMRHPDGTRAIQRPSGDLQTIFPDGRDRTEFKDGTIHVRYPDDRIEIHTPDGHRETRFQDGKVVLRTPEGHRIVLFPDGREFTVTADGVEIEVLPDGRWIQQKPTGERVEVFPDGSKRIFFGDGLEWTESESGVRRVRFANQVVLELLPDGRKVQRWPDGLELEVFPDGTRIQRHPDGSKIEAYPDGRHLEADAKGTVVEKYPDGRRVKRLADPFAYQGAVHREMVRLETLPDSVPLGTSIRIAGFVDDSLTSVYVGIFRLPDGDVVSRHPRLRNGGFKTSLKFREEGLYRLQIHVDAKGPAQASESFPVPVELVGGVMQIPSLQSRSPRILHRTFVVADHLIRVGNPKSVGSATIESMPIRNLEEGCARLLALIDSSRDRAGRSQILHHSGLARAAASRLSEMLALGYFSHESPTGKDASRLVKGGGFRKVGENLGLGYSVEEVHHQLMLSAGHRENILSREWTDLGVAVGNDGRSIWVVEVFGRR